jgi:hypothetical protein
MSGWVSQGSPSSLEFVGVLSERNHRHQLDKFVGCTNREHNANIEWFCLVSCFVDPSHFLSCFFANLMNFPVALSFLRFST